MTKVGPATVVAGTQMRYTYSVTNNGGDAANVSVTDPLPPGTTFFALTPQPGWGSSGPPFGTNGTVTFTNALLPAGATPNFNVYGVVAPSGANGTNRCNTARATT